MKALGDPLKSQGYRTQRAELPEDLWQPLYDRANYAAAGQSSLNFFATPRGQSATLITDQTAAAKTKTYRDTNMENANVIPTKMFKFVGISWGICHADPDGTANPQDRELIRNNSYLQFRIVDKDILFLPMVAVPEVNPMVATTSNAQNAHAGGGGYGVPMYKLPIPITLNPYENFTFSISFDGTVDIAVTLDVYVILQGLNHAALVKFPLINGKSLSQIHFIDMVILSKQGVIPVQLQRLSEETSLKRRSDSPDSYESMRVNQKWLAALYKLQGHKSNRIVMRRPT